MPPQNLRDKLVEELQADDVQHAIRLTRIKPLKTGSVKWETAENPHKH